MKPYAIFIRRLHLSTAAEGIQANLIDMGHGEIKKIFATLQLDLQPNTKDIIYYIVLFNFQIGFKNFQNIHFVGVTTCITIISLVLGCKSICRVPNIFFFLKLRKIKNNKNNFLIHKCMGFSGKPNFLRLKTIEFYGLIIKWHCHFDITIMFNKRKNLKCTIVTQLATVTKNHVSLTIDIIKLLSSSIHIFSYRTKSDTIEQLFDFSFVTWTMSTLCKIRHVHKLPQRWHL
ncbi:hypothetical protein QTP88_009110 [Uroleucon formosanum]